MTAMVPRESLSSPRKPLPKAVSSTPRVAAHRVWVDVPTWLLVGLLVLVGLPVHSSPSWGQSNPPGSGPSDPADPGQTVDPDPGVDDTFFDEDQFEEDRQEEDFFDTDPDAGGDPDAGFPDAGFGGEADDDQIALPLSDLGLRDVRSELMVAIETRDHQGVQEVLGRAEGVDLDEGNPGPLSTAALLGDSVSIALLLRHGADPNGGEDSPLFEAVRSDTPRIVAQLLEAGAEVPGRSNHRALFGGDLRGANRHEVFQQLLDAGGDPQVCLEVSAAAGQVALAALCLEAGADLGLLDVGDLKTLLADPERARLFDLASGGDRPALFARLLQTAAAAGDQGLLDLLITEGAEVELSTLAAALDGGHQDLALSLADGMAEEPTALAEAADAAGLTALASLLRQRQQARWLERAQQLALWGIPLLIALVVGLVLRSRGKRSPKKLHEAIERGDERAVARLLAAGAEVDRPREGLTPLQRAVVGGNVRIVSGLLRRGADGGAKMEDARGFTALHLAAEQGRLELAQLLVRAGTSVEVRASEGETPLYVAALAGEEAMARWLLDQGAEVEKTMGRGSLLCHAVLAKSRLAVRLLLALGADPNPSGGRQPLHLAVLGGQVELVQDLLAAGADRTVRDSSGKTLMEIALQHQQNEVARVLQGDF